VTFVVLFILAAVWAIYAVFWFRGRSEHRSVNSISSFSKHLSILERTSPRRSAPPTRIAGPAPQSGSVSLSRPAFAPVPYRSSAVMTRRQARERRKNVLLGLASATLVTLALSVLIGGAFWYLQLLVDALLVSYVFLLVQIQRMAVERQHKVRYLTPAYDLSDRQAAPLLLRQSAN
jgi:uncharacterized membrane protein YciS (DUF1049 family)